MKKLKNPRRICQVRQAFADYVNSEGCSCCRDDEAHRAAAERLAGFLRVPKFKDGSGYDFGRYKSKV
jgi:hypothetical protein